MQSLGAVTTSMISQQVQLPAPSLHKSKLITVNHRWIGAHRTQLFPVELLATEGLWERHSHCF